MYCTTWSLAGPECHPNDRRAEARLPSVFLESSPHPGGAERVDDRSLSANHFEMEPLSALSLAAAVAQFVDYGLKILGNAREMSSSLSGATEENQSLENATRVMQRLTETLATSKLGSLPDEQDFLTELVAECLSLSGQLLALLDKIKAKDPKSKIQLTLAAVKTKRHEKEKLRLQRRLDDCQLRLDRFLAALSRCVSTMLASGGINGTPC